MLCCCITLADHWHLPDLALPFPGITRVVLTGGRGDGSHSAFPADQCRTKSPRSALSNNPGAHQPLPYQGSPHVHSSCNEHFQLH